MIDFYKKLGGNIDEIRPVFGKVIEEEVWERGRAC